MPIVLGEMDLRFGETCRYIDEAHVQEMQFVNLTPREVRRVSNGCLLRRHAHRELAAWEDKKSIQSMVTTRKG
jgi:hypothetical protein